MSIQFDESLLVIGFLSGPKQDWLGAVNTSENNTFTFTYRFRYYDGDQTVGPHDDGDTKRWYALRSPPGVPYEEAVRFLTEVMDTLVKTGFSSPDTEPYKLERGELSFDAFIEEFKKAPFVHAQSVH